MGVRLPSADQPKQGGDVVVVLLVAVPLVALFVVRALLDDATAGVLPIHWPGLGTPDGFADAGVVFLVTAAVAAVCAIVSTAVLLLGSVETRSRPSIVGLLTGIGSMAVVAWFVCAVTTILAGAPEDAVLGGWIILLVGSPLYGALPAALLRSGFAAMTEQTDEAERFPLGLAERGFWSVTITAWLFVWVGVVFGVVGLVALATAVTTSGGTALAPTTIVSVLLVGLGLLFARMEISVDAGGLGVRSALLRIPIKRIEAGAIERVEATELAPLQWGGWGYRIMPGRSAIILRAGPGLVVTTTNGKQFAITLDDPETPAALLSARGLRAAD